MSNSIPVSYQPKKVFHHRNISGELDVFEAARYFAGVTDNLSDTHKNISVESRIFNNNTRPLRRMSLDMLNHRDQDHVPLQAMLMENRVENNKDKKCKQPNSPGGKLVQFLNSLFNQTSSKKSKSKTKSTKDEDESPGGWRRKKRSSISHFSSGNSTSTTTTAATTATVTSDSKSPFSISASSGFTTLPPYHVPHMPIKTTSHIDPKIYSHLKPPTTQNTKTPINENLNKIESFNTRSDFYDKNMSFRGGFLEKVKIYDEKQEKMKEFKRFVDDDNDDADSDSSSDLFELTSCNLGSRSSGLPVYETTRMVSIKRGASISS
ncbi:hypothetical protein E3N88_37559 [Mikania micrantha]|uniref:Protein BIG GRAIN 1-like E n=1 Tax=Mikania micrantha TaxID=192012 RepID=A0A5N6LTS4_9ASTR|nr:hypothetical protein E3N88_37559 [Mikania micrantha]